MFTPTYPVSRILLGKILSAAVLFVIAPFAVGENAATENQTVANSTAETNIAETAARISQEILDHDHSYANLKELLKTGSRLSGSSGARRAVEWGKNKMRALGADHVWLQPVTVPHWERGTNESAMALSHGQSFRLRIAALGGSVGTSDARGRLGKALEAEVLEVDDLADAEKVGEKMKGKIVFFNHAMKSDNAKPFEEYSKNVGIRYLAAVVGAKYGARAAIIRSLSTLPDDDHPHTGIMSYEGATQKIPTAALSTRAANTLSRLLKADAQLRLKLTLSAQSFSPVESYNVIGEWLGRNLPSDYVVVGGHLDSWDLGPGAHDDGTGVVQSLETLRALTTLGIRPKRTIRTVLFMSEEFGSFGAKEYLKQAKFKGEKHVGAIESDSGGFKPVGISAASTDPIILERVQTWLPYFQEIGRLQLLHEGSGADVSGLAEIGAATFEFKPEGQHYFDLHHSALDTIDHVNRQDLRAGAATMAVMTYLMAELGF